MQYPFSKIECDSVDLHFLALKLTLI